MIVLGSPHTILLWPFATTIILSAHVPHAPPRCIGSMFSEILTLRALSVLVERSTAIGRFTVVFAVRTTADDHEMAPKGLGSRTRIRRELAHKRPPRGAAHKDRAEKASVHGGGIPRGESDVARRALVAGHDDHASKGDENDEKNDKG